MNTLNEDGAHERDPSTTTGRYPENMQASTPQAQSANKQGQNKVREGEEDEESPTHATSSQRRSQPLVLCPYCNKGFTTQKRVKEHTRRACRQSDVLRNLPCPYNCGRVFTRLYELTKHLDSNPPGHADEYDEETEVDAGHGMEQAIALEHTQPTAQSQASLYAALHPNEERGTARDRTMALLRQPGHTDLVISSLRLRLDTSQDDRLHFLHWSSYGREDLVNLLQNRNTAQSSQQHTSNVEEMLWVMFHAYVRQQVLPNPFDWQQYWQMRQGSDVGGQQDPMEALPSANIQINPARVEDPRSTQQHPGFLVAAPNPPFPDNDHSDHNDNLVAGAVAPQQEAPYGAMPYQSTPMNFGRPRNDTFAEGSNHQPNFTQYHTPDMNLVEPDEVTLDELLAQAGAGGVLSTNNYGHMAAPLDTDVSEQELVNGILEYLNTFPPQLPQYPATGFNDTTNTGEQASDMHPSHDFDGSLGFTLDP